MQYLILLLYLVFFLSLPFFRFKVWSILVYLISTILFSFVFFAWTINYSLNVLFYLGLFYIFMVFFIIFAYNVFLRIGIVFLFLLPLLYAGITINSDRLFGTGILLDYSVFLFWLPSYAVFGSFWMIFFTMLLFILIGLAIKNMDRRFLFPVLFIFFILVFPYQNQEFRDLPELSFLMVQGDFHYGWFERRDKTDEIIEFYREESLSQGNFDIIMWPEYVLAVDIENEGYGEIIREISRESDSLLFLGHPGEMRDFMTYYDSVSAYSKGGLLGRYDSINPVIFNTGAVRGSDIFIVEINGYRLGVLICFEELSYEMFRLYSEREVDAILSFSNLWHIHETLGQDLTLTFLRARAKEFNLPVYRVSNTGDTIIVNSKGEIVDKLERGVKDSLIYP